MELKKVKRMFWKRVEETKDSYATISIDGRHVSSTHKQMGGDMQLLSDPASSSTSILYASYNDLPKARNTSSDFDYPSIAASQPHSQLWQVPPPSDGGKHPQRGWPDSQELRPAAPTSGYHLPYASKGSGGFTQEGSQDIPGLRYADLLEVDHWGAVPRTYQGNSRIIHKYCIVLFIELRQ